MEVLTRKVELWQQALGESPEEFAAECGLDAEALYQIQDGGDGLRLGDLKKIAEHTHCPMADLLTDDLTDLLTYRVREDEFREKDGTLRTGYGIELVDNWNDDRVLVSIPDIFPQRVKAERLAKLCYVARVAPEHLADAVDNLLADNYGKE